jgi:hypothetical protein
MIVTPNLGLIVWNFETDPYDNADLAANFFALDNHNHADLGGIQIPTAGIEDGAVTEEKIAAGVLGSITVDDASITAAKIAAGAVTSTGLAAGSVTSSKIGADAVTSSAVADNTVGEEEITTALAERLGVSETSTTRRGFVQVNTAENTTSGTFGDISGGTVGPSATVSVVSNGLVTVFCQVDAKSNGGGNAVVDLREDGTSITGSVGILSTNSSSYVTLYPQGSASTVSKGLAVAVTFPASAGSHIYKLVYKATGTSADFRNRRLWVMTGGP